MPKFNKEVILDSNNVIHCDTENKAISLLKFLDSIGKKWSSRDSYLKQTNWKDYGDKTVYYCHNGSYGRIENIGIHITAISYDDVIWVDRKISKRSKIPEKIQRMFDAEV